MRQPVPCQVLEADDRPLTAGRCDLAELTATGRVWVTALDQPGRLVRRCLLDGLRAVVLALAGARLPAVVEQVTFADAEGHGCLLRLATAPPTPAPRSDDRGSRPAVAGRRWHRGAARVPGGQVMGEQGLADTAPLVPTRRGGLIDRLTVAAGSLALAERLAQRNVPAGEVLARLGAASDALGRAERLLATSPPRPPTALSVRPWEPLPPPTGSWATLLAALAPDARAQVSAAIGAARDATQQAAAVIRTGTNSAALQWRVAAAVAALRGLAVLRPGPTDPTTA